MGLGRAGGAEQGWEVLVAISRLGWHSAQPRAAGSTAAPPPPKAPELLRSPDSAAVGALGASDPWRGREQS